MTSKGAREAALRAAGGAEKILAAKKMKLLHNLHLDPNHMAFMEFEAPSAEAVRDFLLESGIGSYLDCNLHLVTDIAELMQKMGNTPTLYP